MNSRLGSTPAPEPRDEPTRFRRGHLAADAHAAGQARFDFDLWLQAHFALSAERRVDLTMAVNEAVANAAEHAYLSSASVAGTFDVDAHYDACRDCLTVVVEDRGSWLSPDPAAVPQRTRGRGIALMRALADQASIDATEAGTRVSLTWLQLRNRPGL